MADILKRVELARLQNTQKLRCPEYVKVAPLPPVECDIVDYDYLELLNKQKEYLLKIERMQELNRKFHTKCMKSLYVTFVLEYNDDILRSEYFEENYNSLIFSKIKPIHASQSQFNIAKCLHSYMFEEEQMRGQSREEESDAEENECTREIHEYLLPIKESQQEDLEDQNCDVFYDDIIRYEMAIINSKSSLYELITTSNPLKSKLKSKERLQSFQKFMYRMINKGQPFF